METVGKKWWEKWNTPTAPHDPFLAIEVGAENILAGERKIKYELTYRYRSKRAFLPMPLTHTCCKTHAVAKRKWTDGWWVVVFDPRQTYWICGSVMLPFISPLATCVIARAQARLPHRFSSRIQITQQTQRQTRDNSYHPFSPVWAPCGKDLYAWRAEKCFFFYTSGKTQYRSTVEMMCFLARFASTVKMFRK